MRFLFYFLLYFLTLSFLADTGLTNYLHRQRIKWKALDKTLDPYQLCPKFDSKLKICCDGVLYTRTGKRTCCGTQLYNPRSNVCCRGKLHPKTVKTIECCEKEIYDSISKQCCGGVVKGKDLSRPECCGRLQYNPKLEICPIYSKFGKGAYGK